MNKAVLAGPRDDLAWLQLDDLDDELENVTRTRFTYNGVPRLIRYPLSIGEVEGALDECVRRGQADPKSYPNYLDPNFLNDLLFFKLYPKRRGRFISRNEADYTSLRKIGGRFAIPKLVMSCHEWADPRFDSHELEWLPQPEGTN